MYLIIIINLSYYHSLTTVKAEKAAQEEEVTKNDPKKVRAVVVQG